MTDSSENALYQFDPIGALLSTNLPYPKRSGKVRDVYDLGTSLMIVSTDRISAFDYILPSGIPDKGRLLTGMSDFWFQLLDVRHHLIKILVDLFHALLSPALDEAAHFFVG